MSAALVRKLRALNACGESIEYAKQHKSLVSAWAACERGDWTDAGRSMALRRAAEIVRGRFGVRQ